MINYQEFQDFWWKNFHYLFLGVFLFINGIFLILLICFNRKPEREKYFVQRSFHQDLLTWKSSITKMKLYYSKTNTISKIKFYVSRINFVLLLTWLIIWLYTTGFYREYLRYLTVVFGIYFGIEFCLYFLTIRQTIYPNFNNVSYNLTSLMIPFGGARLEDKLPTLRKVIESACEIFEPKAIFLLHNGRDLTPKCYEQIRLITDEYEVNYVYIPLPNKSLSMMT